MWILFTFGKVVAGYLLVLGLCINAVQAAEQTSYQFDIPRLRADRALTALARQADTQILFQFDVARQFVTNPVSGKYTLEEAIELLLKDTGLKGIFSEPNRLAIRVDELKPDNDGEREDMNNRLTLGGAVVAFFAGIFAAQGVDAQQEDIGATRSSATLEEIVVTARKREESLQTIPVSVLAFSPESLEKQNITDLEQLNVKLPNVLITPGGGLGSSNAGFSIRGIGANRNAIAQEAAVALYIDDAYYGRSDGALLNLMDIESIEVLRGPQGTLFGRNATAGAIRYITANPGDDFGGKLQATLGSDDRIDLSGIINLPLREDLALRISAATLNQDGFQTNTIGQDLGDRGTNMFRGKLRWNVNESLDVLATLDYSVTETNGSASTPLTQNPDLTVDQLLPNTSGSLIPNNTVGLDKVLSNDNYDQDAFLDSDSLGASLTINWDLNSDYAVKSATTYRNIDVVGAFDWDGTAAIINQQFWIRDIEMISQEIQLTGVSMDDSLKWITGFYYYHEEASDFRLQQTAISMSTTRVQDPHTIESFAVFGDATYNLTDNLAISAGLRWTRDEKSINVFELNSAGAPVQFLPGDPNGNTGDLVIERSGSWSALSGRVSLEWSATDDVFLYVSYSRGFRSGGINDRVLPGAPLLNYGLTEFDPEKMDSYELGIRSDWFDNRFRLNATVFYWEMSDFQQGKAIPDPVTGALISTIQNAAAAEAIGIEIETQAIVTDYLTIDANVGFLDTQFTEVDPGVLNLFAGDDLGPPKFKFNIGADLNIPLGNASADVRLDYSYSDDQVTNVVRTNKIITDSFALLDANIKFIPSASSPWTIAVYGRNITDKKYLSQALHAGPLRSGVEGRGSEFGVKVDWNF